MHRSRSPSPRCQAGTYQVRLSKPLGIAFEENAPSKPEGVCVAALVDGGNAELDGRILVGDKLIRASAVQFAGQAAVVLSLIHI